ncbi:hypothetical protein R2F61_01815 [Mollicutes bacterium LVI A0078]|nr:hypothetical protein R2F61_01815 [Mollicutes bacterium LVI A0078]
MFREALQQLEWDLGYGAANGLHGIEEVVGHLTSLDFINDQYIEFLHQFDPIVKTLAVFIIVIVVLYAMLFDSKKMPKIMQRIILALVGAGVFINLFVFVVSDIGSAGIESIQQTDSTFGIANSLMNYSVKDYANEDNDFRLESDSWEEIQRLDILEELDHDVEVCYSSSDCEVVREKGDYRYEPSLIFTCLVGVGLLLALLIIGGVTVKDMIEIAIAGAIGLFAIIFSIIDNAPFMKNYLNYLLRKIAKVFLTVYILQSYFMISEYFSKMLILSGYNIKQSGLVYLMIQIAIIITIFDGSATIEKVFGIDLGTSRALNTMIANNAIKTLGGAVSKVKDGAAETLKNVAAGGFEGAVNGETKLKGAGKGAAEGLGKSLMSNNPYRRSKQEETIDGLKDKFGKNEGDDSLGENSSPNNPEDNQKGDGNSSLKADTSNSGDSASPDIKEENITNPGDLNGKSSKENNLKSLKSNGQEKNGISKTPSNSGELKPSENQLGESGNSLSTSGSDETPKVSTKPLNNNESVNKIDSDTNNPKKESNVEQSHNAFSSNGANSSGTTTGGTGGTGGTVSEIPNSGVHFNGNQNTTEAASNTDIFKPSDETPSSGFTPVNSNSHNPFDISKQNENKLQSLNSLKKNVRRKR